MSKTWMPNAVGAVIPVGGDEELTSAWGRFMEAALLLEEIDEVDRDRSLGLALQHAIAGIDALRHVMVRV